MCTVFDVAEYILEETGEVSAQVSTTSSPYLMSQSSQSVQFESFIEDFFSNLSQQQESLGSDFASVLYDNLWDLYQS